MCTKAKAVTHAYSRLTVQCSTVVQHHMQPLPEEDISAQQSWASCVRWIATTGDPSAAYLLTIALPDARLTISRSVCMSSLT